MGNQVRNLVSHVNGTSLKQLIVNECTLELSCTHNYSSFEFDNIKSAFIYFSFLISKLMVGDYDLCKTRI